MSKAGCVLPGHTFAETTGSLKNQQKNALHRNVSLTEAFFANAREAVEYALSYNAGLKGAKRPKRLLCIYAGNLAKSNTYLFWQMVKKHLPEQLISSLHFNKGFLLPANGLKLLTANDPGEILSCVNVEEEAVSYAELIRRNML